jgi:hypothetical protein
VCRKGLIADSGVVWGSRPGQVAEELKAHAWRAGRVGPQSRHHVTLSAIDRTICRNSHLQMSQSAVLNRQLCRIAERNGRCVRGRRRWAERRSTISCRLRIPLVLALATYPGKNAL